MRAEELVVMSYNVENLFDCRHDSLKDDREFLPDAERRWTFGRLWKKLNDLATIAVVSASSGIPSWVKITA